VFKKLIFGAVPALVMMSAPVAAESPAWKVSEVSGKVLLIENGRSRAATRGALLSSGATIATAAAARAVIVRGQEFVVISPGTRIRVPEASGSGSITQLIQDFGSALFKIEKKSSPHFGVQTPYLAAVVKGTTFTVAVGPDGGKVRVTEGAVEVSTLDGGASDLVTPGVVALVGNNDRYTLTIEGRETKILRSGKAPALGITAGRGAPNPASILKGDNRSERAVAVRIAKAIHEKPVSLEKATGGILKDNSASDHAQAEFNDHSKRAIKAMNPDKDKPGTPGKDKPGSKDKPEDGKPDDGKPDEGKPGEGKPEPDKAEPGKDKPEEPGNGGKPDEGGGKPGEGDAGKPGKDDGGKPGGDDAGKPGKDHGDKPDKGDGNKPGTEDDDRPGDDGSKPGKGTDPEPRDGPAGEDDD
jgi:hypothetical protein